MTRKNVWLAALVVFALGGATLLLNPFATEGASEANGGTWADEGDTADSGPAGSLTARGETAHGARTEIAGGAPADNEEDDDLPRPALSVSGRVVSDRGGPVAGARVAVTYRMSFDGARARDFGGGGDRGRAFRARPAAQAVLTDTLGRFTISGRAFESSALEVLVAHKDFAPAAVQRDWQRREGALQLGDIVVGAGALVSGFVVDGSGKGIAGAEVRFQPGDQGGPAAFGGRRGRGGRNGNDESPGIEDLIAAAKSDTSGFFRIEHVPEGRFRLQARAARYLPAVTDALQAKSATTVDAGQLKLILGVEIRGVVVDAAGSPIADARVEAGPSRREGDGNRRDNRGNETEPAPQPDWQAMAAAWRAGGTDRRTRTDKRGEFVLDSLPPGALRLRVEHPRFVTEERQGIDPQKEPRVVVRLEPALTLSGRVIDAATGKPITTYAISAREYEDWERGPGGDNQNNAFARGRRGGGEDGGGGPGGRRRGRTQEGNAAGGSDNGDAELTAMRAAEEARRARRTAYLADRLGPTRQAPRNPGKTTHHDEGRFALTGLQPGRFVVDVMAEDYVGVAFGPVELVKGQAAAEQTIALRLGSQIKGTVEDRVTRQPLAGAYVELLLPDLEASTEPAGMPLLAFRRDAGRVRVTRTRTDAQGRFVLRPQRSGDYWLSLEHDGYNTLIDRAVFVPEGRPLETPAYSLTPGSEVSGRVLNGLPDKQYTLTFWSTSGQRFTARADKELRYHIEGIEPGSYYVLVSDGTAGAGAENGRGRGGGLAGAGSRLLELARGNTRPDVVIAEGAKVQFDIDARAQAPATVRGKVLLNGVAGAGYEVALSSRDDESVNGSGQGLMGRMMGRFLNGRTDEQGQFTITNVPAGNYTLEVRRGGGPGGGGPGGGRGRGGPGGGATVHREQVVVAAGATIERTLAFAIGTVAFEVAQEADGKPVERGNISLVLRSEAASVAADQWRSLPSFTNAQVRNGTAMLRELKLGEWMYRVQAQGQAATEGAVFVESAAAPPPVKVKLKANNPAGAGTAK